MEDDCRVFHTTCVELERFGKEEEAALLLLSKSFLDPNDDVGVLSAVANEDDGGARDDAVKKRYTRKRPMENIVQLSLKLVQTVTVVGSTVSVIWGCSVDRKIGTTKTVIHLPFSFFRHPYWLFSFSNSVLTFC